MKSMRMRLHRGPFERIASGEKKIECRLNDEKRQGLRVGDTIEFVLRDDESQVLEKEIIGLHTFDTFEEMFEKFPEERGDGDMYQYYSKEDEAKHGTLAIELN